MSKWKVTVLLEVEADSYEKALDEGESIMKAATGFLFENVEYEVVTAEQKEVEDNNGS